MPNTEHAIAATRREMLRKRDFIPIVENASDDLRRLRIQKFTPAH
jgi:hypothetical protein